MRIIRYSALPITVAIGLSVAACGASDDTSPASDEGATTAAAAPAATSFPASLRIVGDGYPNSGDACRRVGESAATADWLDDSADLVGCLSETDARALGGTVVGTVDGVTIVSVPSTAAGRAMTPPVAAADSPIRGKGGLEEKCLKRVAEQGTKVIGTNRIEESEASIEIFVNVEGGSAPWRCLGYRNGTIDSVEFTGNEGDL